MPRPTIALMISLAAVSAPAATSTQGPKESWGKAGVSFEQYREDAVECGRSGYYLDVSSTEAAKQLVSASRQLDMIAQGSGVDPMDQALHYANQRQRIVSSTHPDKQFNDIKDLLQATVDRCLKSRGYLKFQLTDDQRRALRKLKIGSEARHIYLYRLASDPAVLAGQAENVAKPIP